MLSSHKQQAHKFAMNTPSRHTKFKVITGYLLLFILTIAAITFIYRQISHLSDNEGLVSTANQKLFIIGNTVTGLYEAEALSNSFLQTGSGSSFRKYVEIIRQVELNIDSLKRMTTEPEQQARIDTIHLLLNDKIRNLKELIKVKKSQEPEGYYNKAIALIESAKDSAEAAPDIRQRVVTTFDSSYIKTTKKKKGFLGLFSSRQPDSTLQIRIENRVVWDTVPSAAVNNPDSIVNILRYAWENFQTETENINRQISRREYNIASQSVQITEQLRKVLYNYEMEEITHSLNRMEQREQVLNSTARLIAAIAIIAVLFIAFFCTLILRDISRSQRYRQQLEAANTYAAQLLKSREQLMLTVTHDIKSPLSSILGYIELLDSTQIDERQRYFLKNMKGSSAHIRQLVGDLLDLSKLENNRMPIENVLFNPAKLFREIFDTFVPLATLKHLEIDCKISEDLNDLCKGDALRIRQILTNILSNAVKYTSQGKIFFSAASSLKDDRMILKIEDTGSGMTPEEQQLIFQEFTRLKSHSAIEGTGLGLTITLKLIQLLDGEMKLESEPGKGSCFTVFLPLRRVKTGSEPVPATTATEIPSRIENPVRPSQIKVLLVDDDPLQLEMTVGLLQAQGIETESTNAPKEVTEKLQAGQYDLVFTDIQMPGMNGFELVRQIRQSGIPSATTLPVIALSADSGKNEADYLRDGFTAYLGKPFTSSQLLQLIARFTGASLPKNNPSPTVTDAVETEGYTLKNIGQFTDNDKTATGQILKSFITETQGHLELLRHNLKEKRVKEIARLAHKMLPMFRQLEANEIVDRLQTIERSSLSFEKTEKITREIIAKTEELIERIRNHPLVQPLS